MRPLYLAVTAAGSLAFAAPAAAVTVFQETFDGYSPAVPWDGGGVWNTGSSVDLVQSGTYNLTCAGGAGNCLDLNGTPGPGAMNTTVTLDPGTYRLSFDYTGNQLDAFGGPWPQAGFTASIGSLIADIGPLLNSNATFQTYSGLFTTTGGPLTLSFTQKGGDPYRGSILDNIFVSSIPEPTTWAMMILGIGLIGGAMRQRTRKSVNYRLA